MLIVSINEPDVGTAEWKVPEDVEKGIANLHPDLQQFVRDELKRQLWAFLNVLTATANLDGPSAVRGFETLHIAYTEALEKIQGINDAR